jgi:inosose dehydratase
MAHLTNRRNFLKSTGAAAGAAASILSGKALMPTHAAAAAKPKFEIGMASYTFRKFPLEDCIAMTKRLGIKNIAFKSFHMAMDSTPQQIRAIAQQTRDAGLNLYSCGVVYMKTEAEVHQAFDYAKEAGMKIIIGVPEHQYLDIVEQKVKDYDISVAIHNHGPGDTRYSRVKDAYDRIQGRDKRLGLCVDIGHVERLGNNVVDVLKKYSDRMLDFHFKDVTASTKEGKSTECGHGVIDLPAVMKALVDINYSGSALLEYEASADDPLPGAAESIGYLRGILAGM